MNSYSDIANMMQPTDGLYNAIVRRLRAAQTMFGQNVKLVIGGSAEGQWSHLSLPYLLVVPTVVRIGGVGTPVDVQETITVPHTVVFIAQLDGQASEENWRAGLDILRAEKQLIGALVNWRPGPLFKATVFSGEIIGDKRTPALEVRFVFTFIESYSVTPDTWLDAEMCEQLNAGDAQLEATFSVVVNNGCCPPEREVRHDSCDPCVADPCAPLRWDYKQPGDDQ
jgi:hypothetical protein